MAAIAFFPFEFVGIPNVGVAFTSRRGGTSEPPHDSANLSFEVGDDEDKVSQNRRLLYDRFALTGWCECKQVHGAIMHIDPMPIEPEERTTLEGDGLATSTPGHGLIIKTADCQPVLLAHESGRYVAALHVGWRGNKINFPRSGVERFCDAYGLHPKEIHAVRGPSLGPEQAEFIHFDTDFGSDFKQYYDPETHRVNLWQITRDQLAGAGVQKENIHSIDLCTMEMEETFFSYRKACASPVKATGRQAGIIWIKQE